MMAKYKNVRPLVALALIVFVTLFSFSVFSLTAAAADGAGAETTESADETTAAETEDASETTAAGDTDNTGDTGDAEDAGDEGLGLSFWISMGVLAVLLIVGVFFGVKYRENLAKWLRGYKSELKKVVWMSWPEVRKNTIVVIVVIVAIGALIAMLDFVFSKGIISLGNLI